MKPEELLFFYYTKILKINLKMKCIVNRKKNHIIIKRDNFFFFLLHCEMKTI